MPDDDLIVISTLHDVYSSVVYKKIDQKAFYEPEMRLRLLPVVGFPLLLFKKTTVFGTISIVSEKRSVMAA